MRMRIGAGPLRPFLFSTAAGTAVLQILLLAFWIAPARAAGNAAAPLTIAEGLRIVAKDSRIVKIAERDRDITSTDVLIARSQYLPDINASTSQTFLAYEPGAKFGALAAPTAQRSSFAYGFDVRQLLYDFGERSSLLRASRVTLGSARLNIDRVRNIASLDFITTYFDLLESEKMVLVAQQEVGRLESHKKVAGDLYSEGVITKNDLLQAEVKLSDAQQALLTAGNRRAIIASRLNTILARPLGTEVRAVDVPVKPPVLPDIDKAWETAERQRIELKALDNELRTAGLEEQGQKSEYFPRLFADGGYNYTENRYLTHQDNWSLVLGATFNIFNGGATKAGIAKVRYREERLLEQRKKAEDDIRLEVERSYFDMKNAMDKIAVTRDAVGQAEENLKINKVKYSEGVGTATDVLDAITLLTTAETNHYRAIYDLQRARADYMYAIGANLTAEYK